MLGRVALLAAPNILGWYALSIFGAGAGLGRAAILGFTMPVVDGADRRPFFREKMAPRLWLATTRRRRCCCSGTNWRRSAAARLACSGCSGGLQLGAWHLLLKRLGTGIPTEALTVWMIGLAVPVFWLLAVALEPLPSGNFSPRMWGVLAYSAAINYGVAQILWFPSPAACRRRPARYRSWPFR